MYLYVDEIRIDLMQEVIMAPHPQALLVRSSTFLKKDGSLEVFCRACPWFVPSPQSFSDESPTHSYLQPGCNCDFSVVVMFSAWRRGLVSDTLLDSWIKDL